MLKNKTKSDDDLCKIAVAPFVGAWIETYRRFRKKRYMAVAPFVGAWIETPDYIKTQLLSAVAPFVGAWIETRLFKERRVEVHRRSFRRSVD